jgi:hypothetical protein
MNEYMLLIRNLTDSKSSMSADEHLQFVKACEVYIDQLKTNGNLVSAQPLIREGVMLSGTPGNFSTGPYNERPEIQVGYYHILAKDIDEAVAIAKGNPEFAFTDTARVEVRPLKVVEEQTSYQYPGKK